MGNWNRCVCVRFDDEKGIMSQAEVFRPASGPLLVRGNLSHGLPQSADVFRRSSPAFRQAARSPARRPATTSCVVDSRDSGYRFGQLSHNSFFARHNPHPHRVRHIKGLLDVPICSVADEGYFSNPRYSLNFPPNNFASGKLNSYSKYYNIPVNAINVNSQMYPINTITGLQYFMGKPLNMRIFRDKAVPGMGMVPVTDAWRDELRALTEAVGLSPADRKEKQLQMEQAQIQQIQQQQLQKRPDTCGGAGGTGRPRTSQYSQTTGRLLPPPSRAMSRGVRRTQHDLPHMQHIAENPDTESMMLMMLSQILQTDDLGAVQSWLVSADDSEKNKMLDMLKAVVGSNEEYYKQHNAEYVPSRPAQPWEGHVRTPPPATGHTPPTETQLGQTDEAGRGQTSSALRHVERLSLVEDGRGDDQSVQEDIVERYSYTPNQRPASQQHAASPQNAQDLLDATKPPVTSDVFRPGKSRGGQSDRPTSGLKRPKTPSRTGSPPNLNSEVKLRYTMTPIKDQDISSQKLSLNSLLKKEIEQNRTDEDSTWQQNKSTVQ